MKSFVHSLLIGFAALAIAGCGVKADDAAVPESAEDAPPPKTPLQRLVGNLMISEDYAVTDKGGAVVATRKMELQGKIDQLVRVREGSEGSLDFETEGNTGIGIAGTISETGHFAWDDPDSNSVIRGRGQSDWNGKLAPDHFNLGIHKSKIASGDEIGIRFDTPMNGKMEVKATMRNGTIMDMPPDGAGFFITLLEQASEDPAKRYFRRDFSLMPALGGVPEDAFSKQLYEAMKENPGMAHTGLITSPNRRAWAYKGTKNWVKGSGDTKWLETVTLDLKLIQP